MQHIFYIWHCLCYSKRVIKKVGVFLENRVKQARRDLGLTQGELADKVNVSRQTIGLIEKNCYNPSLKLCIAIAKALNKTLDQLFWEV